LFFSERADDAHQSSLLFASQTTPQGIVLALLAFQVISQTVILLKVTEESFFDNTDWPWSSASAQASSAVFTFDQMATRLVLGSVKSASSTAAILHHRRQVHPAEPRAPVADGHGRRRPRFLGRSISPQHRILQRGHRLHSLGHQRRATAAQHGQIGRVFASNVVWQMLLAICGPIRCVVLI
jgi:hypothetical protein